MTGDPRRSNPRSGGILLATASTAVRVAHVATRRGPVASVLAAPALPIRTRLEHAVRGLARQVSAPDFRLARRFRDALLLRPCAALGLGASLDATGPMAALDTIRCRSRVIA
jgi:hypothetical protein